MVAWLQQFLIRYGFLCKRSGKLRPIFHASGAGRRLRLLLAHASRAGRRLRLLLAHASWNAKIFFPVAGFLCLLWILIRVVPKPGRISYPCMRASAPLASIFVAWFMGIPAVSPVFRKDKKGARKKNSVIRVVLSPAAAVLLGISLMFCQSGNRPFPNAVPESVNHPVGKAVGIFPGRVVWVWNPEATNGKLTNKPGDGWFLPKNNSQAVIDKMLSDGLQSLSGRDTDAKAWDAIFKFHNAKRGLSGGYTAGEKIFIKINAVSTWINNYNPGDLSIVDNFNYGITETNPATVLSVLRQLIHNAGAAQSDIYVGDPMKHIYKHACDLFHNEFPSVHYLDCDYGAELGREKVAFTLKPAIFYSDRGKIMKAGTWENPTSGPPTDSDRLCTLFETADYLINIPAMKGHKRAGISLFAKNHFGSNSRENALHLHEGLVNPSEKNASRQGYKKYRVQVDLMSHKWLGEKNLFYLLDALYAGPESIYPPTKWKMEPFCGDWTSSFFLSLDPVAIESVGYDFLRSEYTSDTPYNWVQMNGVDDYLHQAADPAARPRDIVYDPEDDGTPVGVLGVHEHWNNAVKKQYSRNLGKGDGIELVPVGAAFKNRD